MNISKLQRRLNRIGADVSQRTLRDWAAKGLITGPEPAPRKTCKRPGRPSKSKNGTCEIERVGEPGRYYEWPEKSYEEAAAVWSLRHLSPILDKKFKVDNDAIIELRREAEKFYYNSWYPEVLSHWIQHKAKSIEIGRKMDPRLVTWISAVEKAPKNVRLDNPMKIVFQWLHKRNEEISLDKEPLAKRSVLILPVEGKDPLNSVEIYICYPEESVLGYRAYMPGSVNVISANEAGSHFQRFFKYYPPRDFVAFTMRERDGSKSIRAYGHYPTGDEARCENGFLLERVEEQDPNDA